MVKMLGDPLIMEVGIRLEALASPMICGWWHVCWGYSYSGEWAR